jgi:hypothetical protein
MTVFDRVKIGDKIRITKSTWNYKTGTIGIVTGFEKNKVVVCFTRKEGKSPSIKCGAHRGKDDFIILGKNRSVVDILNDVTG